MASKSDCIFCQIVAGESPAQIIWEDEKHLAFLSIFPNTGGFTIVASKSHHGSYAFEQDDQVLSELIIATKKTAQILDSFYEDVARCGLFFEGYGVDHLHSKLFPMHGTGELDHWQMIEDLRVDDFFEKYPGYLISNSSHRADDQKLAKLAQAIRQHADKDRPDK
jgi:diadenosine tetraphosphate (Ap4A) HIT family hydrolase